MCKFCANIISVYNLEKLSGKCNDTIIPLIHNSWFTHFDEFRSLCYTVLQIKKVQLILSKLRELNYSFLFSKALGWLDGYVADGKFAAGTTCITVADLALVATYSTLKNTVATHKVFIWKKVPFYFIFIFKC